MNTISFKARFIDTAAVKKFNKSTGNYEDTLVSIVEMNKKSNADISSLFRLSKLWEKGVNFIDTILLGLADDDINKRRIYILTEQKDNFRKLTPAKILGVEEISKEGAVYFIDYLQTKPDTKYKVRNRQFRGIGKSMLQFVIDKYGENKKICLHSVSRAIDFYKKHNFTLADSSATAPLMIHYPDKFRKTAEYV